MSLVEQAAKRLEELRKAGAAVSGELAYSSPKDATDAGDAPSIIERAARKLEALDARRPGSKDAPSLIPLEERSSTSVDPMGLARREPRLSDAVQQVPARPTLPLRPRAVPRTAQKAELDLHWLGAAGYLTPDKAESVIANEFRKIKRPLIHACQGKSGPPVKDANRIMVTSSLPDEGKSFVALNLAISMAMERDSTVLLIDADTTRPSLSQLVGLASTAGLLDLLAGETLDVSDALFRTNVERLVFLPAGVQRPHATELLASDAMERLVQHLASRYADRILIFDTPPLLAASESAVLASYMGQIVVIVEADRTTHKVLANALTAIQSCPVVTTILNKASAAEEGYGYPG